MSALPSSIHTLSSSDNSLEMGDAEREKKGWQLTSLKPKHKQVCAMLAQGIDRDTIAAIVDITPEYVTMLAKQPLVKDYIREMCQAAGLQLDAMFVQSVEVISQVMTNGNAKERIQAARLQLEATKRIGSGSAIPREVIDTNDRLARLAERLLYLQSSQHAPIINTRRNENGTYEEEGAGQQPNQSAQEIGDGSPDRGEWEGGEGEER